MHLITNLDRVYSNKGREWHGLARVPQGIAPSQSLTRDMIRDIMFPLKEAHGLTGMIQTGTQDGIPQYQEVRFPSRKGVVADLTARNEGFIPLEIHTDKYSIAENSRIFQAIESALPGSEVTTAGTLDGCNRFFVSVALAGDAAGVTGDGFRSFLNFISSHDGSLSLQAYTSATRIVCNNTLKFSLRDAANKVRLKHTGDMELKLENLEEFLQEVYARHGAFNKAYDRLRNTRVIREDAVAGILGHFWNETGNPDSISTRTRNAVNSVVQRFQSGKGNHGETMADVLNGYTEYYSIGEGTGKGKPADGTDAAFERQMLSWFGSQADKKENFLELVTGTAREGQPSWQDCVDAGKGAAGQAWKSGLERNRAVNGSYGERKAVTLVQAEAEAAPAAVSVQDGFTALLDKPLPGKSLLDSLGWAK